MMVRLGLGTSVCLSLPVTKELLDSSDMSISPVLLSNLTVFKIFGISVYHDLLSSSVYNPSAL
jgi:hypothetical protein